MAVPHAFISGVLREQDKPYAVTLTVTGQNAVFEGFIDLLAGMLSLAGFEFAIHTWINSDGKESGQCTAIILTQARVMDIGESDDEYTN